MPALENVVTLGSPSRPIIRFYNQGNSRESYRSTGAIGSVDAAFAVSVSGDQLSVDTVTFVVKYGSGYLPNMPPLKEVYESPGRELYVSPLNEVYYYRPRFVPGIVPTAIDLSLIPYGTPVRWECNGDVLASMYLQRMEQVGPAAWKITAISGVGILDKQDHVGNVYTGQTFEEVATEIVAGVFPFTVAPALAEQPVYGWLPYDTARRNLHRLLLALGASILRDGDGNVRFSFLSEGASKAVPSERIDVNGSVAVAEGVSQVNVTEHAYFPAASTAEEQLFSTTDGGTIAVSTPIRFSAPMHSLRSDGLTIEESGVNYAIVSGTGTLYGKPYVHNTRIVSASVEETPVQANVETLRDDFTLVSLANSQNVAARLLAYKSTARTVRSRIRLEGERCGDVLALKDPFGRSYNGFLQSADLSVSSKILARCMLIAGYRPTNQGNNISGHAELSGEGIWISPITGTIQVAVISGGQGGGPGRPGQTAPTPSVSSYNRTGGFGGDTVVARYIMPRNARPGTGGAPGTPGEGGRIYLTTMRVTAGQSIPYSCGIGGAGAPYTGTDADETAVGSLGTDTVFGSVSSASGVPSPSGYIDPISGDQIATVGAIGIAGGDGVGWTIDAETQQPVLTVPDAISFGGSTYSAGDSGPADEAATGQNAGFGYFKSSAEGGFGGGPAAGANGYPGLSGRASAYAGRKTSSSSTPGYARTTAAAGGNGADALPPPKATTPGAGGTSGNGGGGGGAVGVRTKGSYPLDEYLASTTYAENRYNSTTPGDSAGIVELSSPPMALGGAGSDGGQGADGEIRIYWG